MSRNGAPYFVSISPAIGSSLVSAPLACSRLRPARGSNAIARSGSSRPRPRSTFMALGVIWMPAPTRANAVACS